MYANKYYPQYYMLDKEALREKSTVQAIIKNCSGAQELSKDDCSQILKYASAPERYTLGKQTLHIKELKRSSVHYFDGPRGAVESPQLIISHGMICPHFCQYCYWQKDLYQVSRVMVYANPKHDFVKDIKIAAVIWRIFSAFLLAKSCKDKLTGKTFEYLDRKIRNATRDLNYETLSFSKQAADYQDFLRICAQCVEPKLEEWKVPDEEIAFIREFVTHPEQYSGRVIFNSGETNDSVALEHITRVQEEILIPTVLDMDDAYLMLRTKSIHFDFLEQFKDHPKRSRIIISPSLNSQPFIEKYEKGNHSLVERLEALRRVANWGFKIFPSFSPLIYERGNWGAMHSQFIDTLREYLPPGKIHYYAVGSLRLSKQALRNMKSIHPGTSLDSPYFVHPESGSTNKYRYSADIRRVMYAFFIRQMKESGYGEVPHFLQTEAVELWESLQREQYQDLNLDMEKYQSGKLDIKALIREIPISEASKENVRLKHRKANKGGHTKRIISVSRRTDIPAFYSEWFLNRLKEGFAGYVNPFGGGQRYLVSLRPEDVLCFVFWSKNYEPFLEPLKIVEEMGYQSMFHFTITGLPDIFESNLVETGIAIDTMKTLSKMYSPKHVTWRYDPIILSDKISFDFHRENFERIASLLAGYVERCTFSYADQQYRKVDKNLKKCAEEKGVKIDDPDKNTRIKLAGELASTGKNYGITMHTCAGNYLINDVIKKGKCVDGDLLGELTGTDTSKFKIKPTRPECGCTESTDIGTYDTCPHGCVYCYANVNKEKAQEVYQNHDKDSAFLGYSKSVSDKWIAELTAKE